jgi:N-acetyl-gamma-glutamyl-phosphate reductase
MLNAGILAKTKVIDLSADYRFSDISVYEKWYNLQHPSAELVNQAVYGLCEINRALIKDTRLVANPGCYTTCSILTIRPLLLEGVIAPDSIIIDAKSGVSGAGRSAKQDNLYCEVNESIKPYAVASHRHTPEIEEHLSKAAGRNIVVSFTPHLVPMNRGILVTAYATVAGDVSEDQLRDAYAKHYGSEHFIRLLPKGVLPETKWVENSNYMDIAIVYDERTHRVVMMGALDNLVKGAAGQALQNMNIIFGLAEETGLALAPAFP